MAVEAPKSKDLTEQFEESDYVILRGVLPASVIDTLRREIEPGFLRYEFGGS